MLYSPTQVLYLSDGSGLLYPSSALLFITSLREITMFIHAGRPLVLKRSNGSNIVPVYPRVTE